MTDGLGPDRKTATEIRDRLEGCRIELDAHLHPHGGYNPKRAATLQGWIFALSWVLDEPDPYDRTDAISELLETDP